MTDSRELSRLFRGENWEGIKHRSTVLSSSLIHAQTWLTGINNENFSAVNSAGSLEGQGDYFPQTFPSSQVVNANDRTGSVLDVEEIRHSVDQIFKDDKIQKADPNISEAA